MSEVQSLILGLSVLLLASWKALDLLRLAWRGIGIGARGIGRGVVACARGVGAPFRALGAWWRRKALAVARVRDHRDHGMVREQAATIALLANQVADLSAKLSEVSTNVPRVVN